MTPYWYIMNRCIHTTWQESPPTWTQEAYRAQLIKYSICCPIPAGGGGGGRYLGVPPHPPVDRLKTWPSPILRMRSVKITIHPNTFLLVCYSCSQVIEFTHAVWPPVEDMLSTLLHRKERLFLYRILSISRKELALVFRILLLIGRSFKGFCFWIFQEIINYIMSKKLIV